MAAEVHTLLGVVQLSTGFLGRRGSETPRLDAELLAAHALGIRRIDLYLQFDRPLDEEELSRIRELVRRRAGHEPIAYILGEREFFGRRFRVAPAVLIPRPDTETLIDVVLEWARAQTLDTLQIVDLGTGSGCIGVTLAAELGAQVTATDISPAALDIARENADAAGAGERMSFVTGNWWDAIPPSDSFNVVASNPPYVATSELSGLAEDVRDHEPEVALVGSGEPLAAYQAILSQPQRLARPGLVALEVDPRRADAVAALAEAALPGTEVALRNDLTGRPRVVTAMRR